MVALPSRVELAVSRESAGLRLDRFLVVALAGHALSRAEIQRWIEHGRVTVDGVVCKAGDKVKLGGRVIVLPDSPARSSAVPEDGIAFDILYEDDALIVVNKPPGLVVHPARGHESGTLVNGLLGRGVFNAVRDDISEAISEERDSAGYLRPGIVHRLDKGTSGVMVVARTARSRERLKEQFSRHSIDREYVAICVGEARAQTISSLHGRHRTDRLRFTTRVSEGKRAVTHVRVLEPLANGLASYVACRLETGRTHQIRVHLSEVGGTPILGDSLYGRTPRNARIAEVGESLGHQALHARLLGFVHPYTEKRMSFEAEPPADFIHALTELRSLPA